MSVYVICHGAWGGGWAWKKMRPLLRAAGHELVTPTYTGLGERAHLAHPMVDLEPISKTCEQCSNTRIGGT